MRTFLRVSSLGQGASLHTRDKDAGQLANRTTVTLVLGENTAVTVFVTGL